MVNKLGEVSFDKPEPVQNLITWVYEQGSFVPCAKLTEQGNFSIISDYIGRPIQAYDNNGNLVWQTDYDIYGNLRNLHGDRDFIPFRQLGQYEDYETGLYYNRFRYYDCNTGTYISQDPISILGGLNVYAYVKDVNAWVDVFGLKCKNYNRIIPGKNFKEHFINHKKLVENLTGNKYPKFKSDSQTFLDDIQKLIDNKVIEYIGEGTLKKGQPLMDIFRNDDITIVVKDLGNNVGEWVTALEKGKGLDLGIIFK